MKPVKTAFSNPKTGRPIPNFNILVFSDFKLLEGYKTIICKVENTGDVTLDPVFWNWGATTAKYRAMFLQETTKESEAKIKEGVYKLEKLNQI